MNYRRTIRMLVALLVVLAVTTACAIPFLSGGTDTPPEGAPAATSANGEPAAPGSPAQATEAAATAYAPLAATWTAQYVPPAGAQPTVPAPGVQQPPAQPGAPALPVAPGDRPLIQPVNPQGSQPGGEQPALMPSLPTRTPFWAPLASPQPQGGMGPGPAQPAAPAERPVIQPVAPGERPVIQPVDPQSSQPGAPLQGVPGNQPAISFLPEAPAGFFVKPGEGFKIVGVNLPVCGGVYSANFLILNGSGAGLESASFKVTDLSNGAVLSHTPANDTPFMNTDTTCTPGGVERLDDGYSLFLGGSLGAPNLTGHTLQIDIQICTQNGMAGQCYNGAVEFVVP